MGKISNSLDTSNKYADPKYELQKIHKKRVDGHAVALVSRFALKRLSRPDWIARLHKHKLRALRVVRKSIG